MKDGDGIKPLLKATEHGFGTAVSDRRFDPLDSGFFIGEGRRIVVKGEMDFALVRAETQDLDRQLGRKGGPGP